MEEDMEVKPEEIRLLLEYFSKNTYKARDSHPKVHQVMQRCLGLFGLDYNYSVIPNTLGELSTNYPSNLVILISEKGQDSDASEDSSSTSVHCNGNNGAVIDTAGNGSFENHAKIEDGENIGRQTSPPRCTTGRIDLLLESESFVGTSLQSYHMSSPTLASSVTSNGNENSNSTSLIVTGNKTTTTTTVPIDGVSLEASKLKDLCSRARFARCRARFPVSVMLYNKTHICRSATLSGGAEIYGRSSFDYFFSGGGDYRQFNDPEPEADDEIVVTETQSDWQLFDRVRSLDIRLLKSFQVQTIFDLMVEKKKVKFGVNVTSSEKVDKENRYAEFNLISLPYPGCEFFKDYRDKGYNAEDLVFEWNQGHVDADIFVPTDITTTSLNTDWTEYRKWDLVTLTQKYLKLLLAYVRSGDNGVLVHCISGWDRTPLFISLLRLSLWADGAIHKSLSAEQILYLTLAYDWLLFGHNLEDRLSKGEEILFFCFYFLKYIIDGEFCIEEKIASPPPPSPPPPTPPPPPPIKIPQVIPNQNNIRVRNDSDIQLDGVLLEGDGCHTSPEGSNWSLNSVESSHSNKSQDNPPAYFQIPQDSSSWEDCNGIQQLLASQRHSSSNSNQNNVAQYTFSANNGISSVNNGKESENSSSSGIHVKTFEPAITVESPIVHVGLGVTYSSSGAGVNRTCSTSSTNGVSVSVSPLSSGVGRTNLYSSSSSRQSPLSLPTGSSSSLSSTHDTESGSFQSSALARTSPVAVPSRVHHHRPESTSSASIGSWQLITGPGSMREAISSSDPGSSCSISHTHSHPLRMPTNGAPDCIETSESSCTLVDQLNPVSIIDSVESLTESVIAVPEPSSSLRIENLEINDPLRFAATEINMEAEWREFENGADNSNAMEMQDSIFASQFLTPGGCGLIDGTPTNATPTKDHEGLISPCRREKLQSVRARFYTLYATAIGFKFRSMNDNSSSGGGGLGFFIGNFLGASKMGNRTVNRTTNL